MINILKSISDSARLALIKRAPVPDLIDTMRGDCDWLLLRNPKDFDTWNDLICLCGPGVVYVVEGTVDPGSFWKGSRRYSQAGTGRLADGAQPGVWKYQEKWKDYPAWTNFPNNGTARQLFYRDRNDNDQIEDDERVIGTDHALMHLHRVFKEGSKVYASSAGCVVPGRLDNIKWLAAKYKELFPQSYKSRLTGPFIADITRDRTAEYLYEFLGGLLGVNRRAEYRGEKNG
jgi:hypothetical protein